MKKKIDFKVPPKQIQLDYKVKLNESDTPGFLEEKVGDDFQIVDNKIKLKPIFPRISIVSLSIQCAGGM